MFIVEKLDYTDRKTEDIILWPRKKTLYYKLYPLALSIHLYIDI